jgi:L-amino acid N-acyltransferase YncA
MNVDMTAMNPRDWDAVRAIYQQGIASGNSTFEKDAPAWEKWTATICAAAGWLPARKETWLHGRR